MAHYNIIGGDKKEYGPISFDQVQGWIREGRANAQTMIQTDSKSKCVPLGQCPEFVSLLGGTPVANPNTSPPTAGYGTAMAHNPSAKSKMTQYNIIGGNGEEYGPISFDQVQGWIREGRANAQTMIHTDTSPKWVPLGRCSEFTSLLGGSSVSNPNINLPMAGLGMARAHHPNAKSKIAAGVLGLLIGSLGIHRFYLGYTGIGIAQVMVTILTCGLGGLWGFIEGIMILTGSSITTDADGIPLKD